MKIMKNLYTTKDGIKCYAAKVTEENMEDLYKELYGIRNDVVLDIDRGYIGISYYQNNHIYRVSAYPNSWVANFEGTLHGYSDEDFRDIFSEVNKTISIKYFSDKIERLRYIDGKSDWIDLRSAAEISMKAGEFKLIPLGIAMQLPQGYEAHVVPRSSTFKNYGIIQTNSMGIIDETYCGNNDQWFFPAYALRDTEIHINDRICQFRIMEHQPSIIFDEVPELDNEDRGGHGSTGKA